MQNLKNLSYQVLVATFVIHPMVTLVILLLVSLVSLVTIES